MSERAPSDGDDVARARDGDGPDGPVHALDAAPAAGAAQPSGTSNTALAAGTPQVPLGTLDTAPAGARAVGTLDTAPAPIATLDTMPAKSGPARPAPEKLGRFVVIRTLGSGGMGTVYAAHDPELDRKVALKLVRADVRDDQPEATRRALHREAKAMAKVEHPNVITVFDVGTIDEQLYIAMELVAGGDLRAWMTRATRSWDDVVRTCLQAGAGLAAAHKAGLVHRDFKPDNVLIGDDGRARVTDFGIARVVMVDDEPADAGAPDAPPKRRTDPSLRLTRTGALVGTPAYMAPEQHNGEPADARSDQFAFCVTVWEALFGERPFEGKTYSALAMNITEGRLREPPKSNVPARIVAALRRGMSVDPAARFASMEALAAELTPERKRTWVAPAVALAVLMAGGGAIAGVTMSGAPAVDACAQGELRLAGIWDGVTRARIQGAFLATHKPFAADAWRGVDHALGAFTARWVSMYRETCQANRARPSAATATTDPRMWCLDDRLRNARALVDVLVEADARGVARATNAATNLPEVEICADARTLSQQIPPRDQAAYVRIESLRAELARGVSLFSVGEFKDALAILERVAEGTKREAYPPLEADALLQLARARFTLDGDAKAAEKTALAGLLASEQGRHDRARANAWLLVTFLQGAVLAHFDDAARSSDHAAAVIRGLAGGEILEARLLGYKAQVLTMQGSFADAEKLMKRSVELMEKASAGADLPELTVALSQYSDVVRQLGDLPRARSLAERAYALSEKIYGPRHPETAKTLFSVALAYEDEGNNDEAAARLEKTIQVLRDALGPEHGDLAPATDELGLVRKRQGRVEEALELHRAALAIRERVHGPDHPETSLSLGSVARDLKLLGRQAEALPLAERALEIGLDAFGPDGPEASDNHGLVGNALFELKRFREAQVHFEAGLAAATKAFGPDSPKLAFHLSGIGDSLLEQKKPRDRSDGSRRRSSSAVTTATRSTPP